MRRYILRRLLQGLVLLVLVATIVFFLGRLTGNPVDLMLPEDAEEVDRVALIKTLGLDKPLHEQFGIFLAGALRGDLGVSIRHREPAVKVFFSRLPNTLKIVPGAMLLALVLAVPLGILSALYRGGIMDRVAGGIAVLGIATPNFWLGILLIYVFSVKLGWLPSARMGGFAHYVLPTITLGTFLVAGYMRLIRSSMLEVLDSEFVKLARIKGMSESIVVWKHCLRNAGIAPLTFFAIIAGSLLTGAVVTETVFTWPGVGLLVVDAVRSRDFQVVQAVVILFAGIFILCNLLVDILYAFLDPRIRYQ